ncbi:MAG TPA: triose-phosphate isomerase [Ktedonobacteraceae bacterium]|nr:triose-phosphate isomerase [Ktedonobacteraceae bacterium]
MTTSSRTAIIAGNWKMHYGPNQASQFALEIIPPLGKLTQEFSHIVCVLCPPTISLQAVREVMDALLFPRIALGAQNMYYEDKGAFTGENSPSMVHELCSYVILGHSERRGYFCETDEQVNKKVRAALANRLRPIVCVGEKLEEHEAGKTEEVIRTQVHGSLGNLPQEQAHEIVIAYEPIWAIGTGKSATAQGAGQVIALIRQLFGEMYGSQAANAIRILYGGSVTSANISEFVSVPAIDGALVGGASIKADFIDILRKTIAVMKQHT